MSTHLIIKDENDGFAGGVEREQIVAVMPAYDDEAMVYIYLRNGTVLKSYIGYDDPEGAIARILSDLGWT